MMVRGAKIVSNALIADDGLPLTSVGEWTLQKHERLRRYVGITRAVRQKFARTETTYIDLYCGPGRSVIEENGEIIDGSPVIAARTAKDAGVTYTDLHLADVDPNFVDAACKRVPPAAGRIHRYQGAAEDTVGSIVARLSTSGLHFAFLDPYKLDPLPFSIIGKLASLKHMDMLIHVSIHDWQRNLRLYMTEHGGPLDRFAPGWRDAVDERGSDNKIRRAIFNHWIGLIRALDMAPSEGIEIVSGSKRQPLYWLVLVARHELAHEFWDKIRNVSQQGRLDL
jgi:three-Cys-motif partner protein